MAQAADDCGRACSEPKYIVQANITLGVDIISNSMKLWDSVEFILKNNISKVPKLSSTSFAVIRVQCSKSDFLNNACNFESNCRISLRSVLFNAELCTLSEFIKYLKFGPKLPEL